MYSFYLMYSFKCNHSVVFLPSIHITLVLWKWSMVQLILSLLIQRYAGDILIKSIRIISYSSNHSPLWFFSGEVRNCGFIKNLYCLGVHVRICPQYCQNVLEHKSPCTEAWNNGCKNWLYSQGLNLNMLILYRTTII